MRYLIAFLLLIFLFACRENKCIIHYFDQYSKESKLSIRNMLIKKINPLGNNVYEVTMEGRSGDYWFYENFLEKYVPGVGIYRRIDDNEYMLHYRFDSSMVVQKVYCPEGSKILYPNITLSEKKSYSVNGKNFFIFKYAENYGTIGIISYFLEPFGFFAYDLNNGYYLLCNRSSDYNKVNKDILNVICDSLINDTCFFSIYRIDKNNPCFKNFLENITPLDTAL